MRCRYNELLFEPPSAERGFQLPRCSEANLATERHPPPQTPQGTSGTTSRPVQPSGDSLRVEQELFTLRAGNIQLLFLWRFPLRVLNFIVFSMQMLFTLCNFQSSLVGGFFESVQK